MNKIVNKLNWNYLIVLVVIASLFIFGLSLIARGSSAPASSTVRVMVDKGTGGMLVVCMGKENFVGKTPGPVAMDEGALYFYDSEKGQPVILTSSCKPR